MWLWSSSKAPALVLALAFVAVLVPAGDLPGVRAQGTCSDLDLVGYITLSHPLAEQFTVTAFTYLVVAELPGPQQGLLKSQRHLINGIDALVVDPFCTVSFATYCVTGSDTDLDEYDLAVQFLNAQKQIIATKNDPDSPDVCDGSDLAQQTVPSGTRYIVIFLAEGVPAAGITPGFPPRPYAARVAFEMAI